MIDTRRPATDDRRPMTEHPVVRGRRSVVVIGYGSDLRGDDAAGRRVAEAVRGWGLAGVAAIVAHQLAPELAEPLSRARRALFVDACPAERLEGRHARVVPLWPIGSAIVAPVREIEEVCHEGTQARRLSSISNSPFVSWRLRGEAIGAIQPMPTNALGHTGDPAGLLALAEALYGARPEAWLVTVPAASFEIGAELSGVSARGVREALRLIRALLA